METSNFGFFRVTLAVLAIFYFATSARASEQMINLGDVNVSVEINDPHWGDLIRPGEIAPFGQGEGPGTYRHDSLKLWDHCGANKDSWFWEFWGKDCSADIDDYGHYLLPCLCWCNTSGDCELARARPTSNHEKNTSGDACTGVEIKNNCGEKTTSGLPGDNLPDEPGLDFEPVSTGSGR